MKIGMVTDSCSRNAGGLFESVRRLSQSIRHRTREVVVFGVEDKHTRADLHEWQPMTVHVHERKFPQFWGYAPGLEASLLESDLDVLMTHGIWQYASVATLQWHRKTGRPHVIHPHGMLDPWALKNSWWKKQLAARLYENANLHGSACLRALCESEAESMRAYGLTNPICVIPNGIDLPDTTIQHPSPWADKADGRKVLLYLGRLHPKKNIKPLIQAWAAMQKETAAAKDWALAIVGWDQNGHEDELKSKVCELGVEDSVFFPGPLFGEAKAAAYQHASAFVLPSLSEGLPMVVLEAWAYALPVLMTDACNLPEASPLRPRGASRRIQRASAMDWNRWYRLLTNIGPPQESVDESW